MDVPVRNGNLKIKMTFQAALRFHSGAIQLYTLRYMQKQLDRTQIVHIFRAD